MSCGPRRIPRAEIWLICFIFMLVASSTMAGPPRAPHAAVPAASPEHFVAFDAFQDVTAVACGSDRMFFLRSGGRVSVVCGVEIQSVDSRGGCLAIGADGERCYVLKENGSIWCWKDGSYVEVLASGALRISVSQGTLYALLGNGTVRTYRPAEGWAPVPGCPDLVSIDANPEGIVGTGRNGDVFRFTGKDHSWKTMYDRSDAKMASGDQGKVFILTKSGTVWLNQQALERLDSRTDTERVCCLGGALYAVKRSGEIWTYDVNGEPVLRRVYTGKAPRDLAVFRDEHLFFHHHLFVVEGDGSVWQDNYGIHGRSPWGQMDRFQTLQR